MSVECVFCNIKNKQIPSDILFEDDYCFVIIPGRTEPITLQGGNNIPNKNFFKVIPNHPDLIGAASSSDMNDRYSKISHSTYEYKIPLEIFGKSDIYGFYVGVYDDKTKKWQSWPKDSIPEIRTDKSF